MKYLRFMQIMLFSLLIVLLGGCSSTASGPFPTATSAVYSLPAVSGDCPLADLQPWYSYSIVNTKQFMQMLDSAAALKPAQVGPLQARLVGTLQPAGYAGCSAVRHRSQLSGIPPNGQRPHHATGLCDGQISKHYNDDHECARAIRGNPAKRDAVTRRPQWAVYRPTRQVA